MTERRTARRYELSLPVVVRSPMERPEGNASKNGQTRDISTRGVYFVIAEEMAPGAELDFTLTLPAEITRGTEVFIRAHGKVVRVDRVRDDGSQRLGIAAVIEKYDIIRAETVAS
jgi:hypothetical protein